MHLSARARAISPSTTIAIDTKTKQLIAEGIDVVNFSVGEPDLDTPEEIKQAGIQAIQSGRTKYTPTPGTLELRKAVCQKLLVDNGLEYKPEQIVVSNGGKQALFNTVMVVVDPGDEVIIPAPYWVSYPEMVKLAGGVPVIIPTDESTGFKVTADMLKAHITSRTRAMILNSPSNPTGAVYTKAELMAIAEVVLAHDLYVITDEIYEKLVYAGAEHHSIASFDADIKQRTITVNGMSKAYAMTGWRMGYAAAETAIAKAMGNLQSQTTSCPSAISQAASVQALTGSQAPIETMRQEFDRRRRYTIERLKAMPGLSLQVVPDGAFYVFPNVSALYGTQIRGHRINNDDDLAQLILTEANVGLVPGSGFGTPNYIRISYATSMERITEGLNRIEALLREAE